MIDVVDVFAKVANPLPSILDPRHERIHVGATVFAANELLIIKTGFWNFVAARQLPKRFNYDCKRHLELLLERA